MAFDYCICVISVFIILMLPLILMQLLNFPQGINNILS